MGIFGDYDKSYYAKQVIEFVTSVLNTELARFMKTKKYRHYKKYKRMYANGAKKIMEKR